MKQDVITSQRPAGNPLCLEGRTIRRAKIAPVSCRRPGMQLRGALVILFSSLRLLVFLSFNLYTPSGDKSFGCKCVLYLFSTCLSTTGKLDLLTRKCLMLPFRRLKEHSVSPAMVQELDYRQLFLQQ